MGGLMDGWVGGWMDAYIGEWPHLSKAERSRSEKETYEYDMIFFEI